MVRKLFVIMIVLLGSAFINVSAQESRNYRLNLQVGIVDPTSTQGGHPRGPILMPEACLDGYTLYIEGDHPAYELYLVDCNAEEPDVVYQITVPANVSVIYLPATLTGTFELQLYDGGEYYFYSEIEL